LGAFVLFSGFGLAINIDSTQGYFMTSQINPNNIDGNYPVAGVPNNTQGFRDNFTNTSTNFQYASDEITELQSKGVFKAALTGTTLDNNMNDGIWFNYTGLQCWSIPVCQHQRFNQPWIF